MNDYIQRFKDLAATLESHPKIELLNFETFPPVSEEEIKRVEDHLACPLDEKIRGFFKESNGLQLLWVHKENDDYNPETFPKFAGSLNQPEYSDAYRYSDGCIYIQELRDIFLESSWEDVIWRSSQKGKNISFRGKDWDALALMKGVYPFDIYAESECMAFLAPKGHHSQEVLMAKDYYIEIDGSRITNFESYLEFLLATMGAVSYRSKVFAKPQGHRMEVLHTLKEFWNADNSYSPEAPPEW